MSKEFNKWVDRFRNNRRFFLFFTWLYVSLTAFLISAIAFAAVDFNMTLDTETRRIWTIPAVAISTILLIYIYFRFVLKFNRISAVREIENNNPHTGQLFRTIIQSEDGVESDKLKKLMMDQVNKDAQTKMGDVDLLKSYPWKTVLFSFLLFSFILISMSLTAVFSDGCNLAVSRILDPENQETYTKVSVEYSHKLLTDDNKLSTTVKLSGRTADDTTLHYSFDNKEWKTVKMNKKDGSFIYEVDPEKRSLYTFVTAGDATSKVTMTIYRFRPKLVDKKFTLSYPEYLQIKSKDLDGGTTQAVEGSKLSAHLLFDKTIEKLILADGKVSKELKPQNKECSFNIPVEYKKHKLVFTGIDQWGLKSDPVKLTIIGQKDQKPNVAMITPYEDIEATQFEEVDVVVGINDDFGLSEAGVLIQINNDPAEVLVSKKFETRKEKRCEFNITAMLEKYNLNFKSCVQLYAYAKDWKPAKKREGLSKLINIDIKPFDKRYLSKIPPPPSGGGQEELFKLDDAIRRQRKVQAGIFRMKGLVDEDVDVIELVKIVGKRLFNGVNEQEHLLIEDLRKFITKLKIEKPGLFMIDTLEIIVNEMGEVIYYNKKAQLDNSNSHGRTALVELINLRELVRKNMNKSNPNQSKKKCNGKGGGQPKDAIKELGDQESRLAKMMEFKSNYYQKNGIKPIPGAFSKQANDHKQVDVRFSDIQNDLAGVEKFRGTSVMDKARGISKDLGTTTSDFGNKIGSVQGGLKRNAGKLYDLSEHIKGLNKKPESLLASTIEKAAKTAKEMKEGKQQSGSQSNSQSDSTGSKQSSQSSSQSDSSGSKQSSQSNSQCNSSGSKQGSQSKNQKNQKESGQSAKQNGKDDKHFRSLQTIKDWAKKLNNSSFDEEIDKKAVSKATDQLLRSLNTMNVDEEKINQQNRRQIIQQLQKLASELKSAKEVNALSQMEHLAKAESNAHRMKQIAAQKDPTKNGEEFNEKLLGLIKELNKVDDKNFEAVKRYLKRKIDRAKQKQASNSSAPCNNPNGECNNPGQGKGSGKGQGKGAGGQGSGNAESQASKGEPNENQSQNAQANNNPAENKKDSENGKEKDGNNQHDDKGANQQAQNKNGKGGNGRRIPPNTVLDISPEALNLILKRIRAAMALEVRKCLAHDRDVKVPAQYENNVEKYYQNLSDDMD